MGAGSDFTMDMMSRPVLNLVDFNFLKGLLWLWIRAAGGDLCWGPASSGHLCNIGWSLLHAGGVFCLWSSFIFIVIYVVLELEECYLTFAVKRTILSIEKKCYEDHQKKGFEINTYKIKSITLWIQSISLLLLNCSYENTHTPHISISPWCSTAKTTFWTRFNGSP